MIPFPRPILNLNQRISELFRMLIISYGPFPDNLFFGFTGGVLKLYI